MPGKLPTDTAESFVGSVFKYSVSTFVNIGILGLSMLLTGLFIAPEVNNQITLFTQWTNTIMTIAILGLDQSLIRFYHERPGVLSKNGLFRVCFYLSSAVVLVAGIVGSTVLSGAIYTGIGFAAVGPHVVPLLFLNALFYMTARYFNVLYRMEGNIRVYTAESILMQFFYKMFYLAGAFLPGQNPVPAMVLCSVLGLGAFALVFSFLRRDALRPQRGEFSKEAYRTVMPYGLAVAPTAVMITLNTSLSNSVLTHQLGRGQAGIYGYAVMLSNVVTMVQGGFASFWGPYMFENYKTQQARIKRVHNYLNLIILCFFALLVAFEDILFFVLRQYRNAQPIFPLMMLSAVFTILCETTVYGNAIARRPIFDTIGHGLSFASNLAFVLLLAPQFELVGAAIALAVANGLMFLMRTLTAQRLYQSIATPGKTVAAVLGAVVLAAAGTVLAEAFFAKLLVSFGFITFYILLYRDEFIHCVRVAFNFLANAFARKG